MANFAKKRRKNRCEHCNSVAQTRRLQKFAWELCHHADARRVVSIREGRGFFSEEPRPHMKKKKEKKNKNKRELSLYHYAYH